MLHKPRFYENGKTVDQAVVVMDVKFDRPAGLKIDRKPIAGPIFTRLMPHKKKAGPQGPGKV